LSALEPDRARPGARTAGSSDRAFLVAVALAFVAASAATVHWCTAMTGDMPMPGGWTLSMIWMPMPGQPWLGAAAGFLGMWMVMMVAMMQPSLVAMLWDYRRALRTRATPGTGVMTAVAGAAYFTVWLGVGFVALGLGTEVAAVAMRSPEMARLAPFAAGVALLLAGAFQISGFKVRQLARCRDARACGLALTAGAAGAWRDGLRFGARCSLCCAGLMAVLLLGGMMRLTTVVVVAAAITVERLAPWPALAARAAGLLVVAAGTLTLARAAGLI
jgi:predicted metal-binding membrane protein